MVTQEVATPTFPDVKVISLCGSSDYTETFLEMQGNEGVSTCDIQLSKKNFFDGHYTKAKAFAYVAYY